MVRRGRVMAIATVCVAVFMVSLDLFIVNIAFPDIEKSFRGTSLSDLSWILSAYAIAFGSLLVPSGRWADRAGRKTVFMLGLAVFTAASAACALAPSALVLVIARAIQGSGAAMVFPTSLGLLLPEWPPEKHSVAVAIWAAVGGVAAAAAPPLGGLLVQAGWHWVFIVNLPIGVVTLALGMRVLRNPRDERAVDRPDVASAAMFTVAIAALILAIVQGQSWGWGSARVVGLFCASAVLIALVVVRSARHPAPLVEPVIVRTRAIALANLSAVLLFIAFAGWILGAILFQTAVWHDSALTAGLQFAPGPAMSAIFAVPGGVLGQRLGQRYVGAVGALMFAAAVLWFRSRMTLEPHYSSQLLPVLLLGGSGVGLLLPTLSEAATGPLPPSRFATGAAVLGMSRQVGAALGVALFVAILGHPTPATALDDFGNTWAFLAASLFACAAALLAVGPVRMSEAAPLEAAPTV